MNRAAGFVIRYRVPVIIIAVCVTGVLGFFLKDLKINPDILSYLPQKDPVTRLNTYVSETYGGSQIAVVAYESEDIFSRNSIETVHRLTEEFGMIDGIQSVTSLTNAVDIRSTEDGLEIGRLIDPERLPVDESQLDELKNYVSGRQMYNGRLVSGNTAIIVCRLREDADKGLVAGIIRDTVDSGRIEGRVFYAGLPFQLIEISAIVLSDIIRLVPLAVVLILVSLFFSFRSVRGVILPVLSAGMSCVWTLGIMSLFGIPFSVISNVIPVVLLAVGSAYSIHVISRFNETTVGDSRSRAREALKEVALPVSLAAFTTLAGFTAFIFGSYLVLIRHFGIFSSLGVVFSFLISLTFVPAVLSLLPVSTKVRARKTPARMFGGPGEAGNPPAGRSLTGWMSRLVTKHNLLIVAIGTLLIAVSIVGMPFIRTEVNILSYFKPNTDIRLSEEMMERDFGGSNTLQLLVKANIKDPKVLKDMKEAEDFLKARPELNNVHSIVELIEEMTFVMIGERRVPDTEEQVANLWFLLEGEEALLQLVNADVTEAVIQATVDNPNSTELIRVIEGYIAENRSDDISFQLAGSLKIYERVNESINRSLIQSLGIAFLLIFLCNIVLLGSLRGGLIGLIPIAFTLFVLFGTMGFTGIPLDVATVLIGSISLGIGIDYSIHFMNRFRREYRETEDTDAAIRITLATTGRAILVNMVTVSLGFLVLVVGNLIPLRRFSILITVTMIGSGLGALLLLPAIMRLGPVGTARINIGTVLNTLRGLFQKLMPVKIELTKSDDIHKE